MDFDFQLDEPVIEASLEDVPEAREVLVPEKHLDSPILVSLLDRLQDLMEKIFNRNPNIRRTQYDIRRQNCIHLYLKDDPIDAYSSIRHPLLQYSSALDHCLKKPKILTAEDYPFLFSLTGNSFYRLRSDMRWTSMIYEKEVDEYLLWMRDICKPDHIQSVRRRLLENLEQPRSDVIISGKRCELWSRIVDDYRRLYKKHRNVVKREYGPLRVVLCDGFLLIKHDSFHEWRLLTYEQLQMIQDCCLARHNIYLALQFKFHNGTEQLRTHVNDVIEWQENVLLEFGNDGYELVKAPEAIFKTHLNSLTNGDLLSFSSYNRTLEKMREKQRKLKSTRDLIGELDRIVKRVDNIHDAAELFGLSKMSGHPSVYAARSAESVRKEAEPKGIIQPFAVRQMTRMFKHLALSGYILKHSSWPKLTCPPARNTQLRRHYVNQVTTLPLGSYPLSDLDAIRFGKFVEYDYSEDYLKFLDDKAICPGASEMSKFWFTGERKESRRLLQRILTLEHFDTVKMVERLRKGQFTDDERVVELTQKERELKVAARCFCKLPIEVRTFFTSTEYNLKEQFMKHYMPQQTMTMSNTETKQRLYNLVRTAKQRDRTLLEVDFSRWNLRWRQETVHPISSILEDIFGLPGVFSQAHPFFESATIVLTDKHTLPEGATPGIPVTQWPTSALVWRHSHLGGFEGIQQALWTACTIAMMYWVLHDQNLSFNMAGQGDNQIFAITFSDDGTPAPERLRKLLAVMEVRCALLNHEVKPDECIDSQTVLTYSKEIYVEGVHVLYNLKFASRSFRRDEIDIPSFAGEVSAVSAISMACADSVYETFRAVHWRTFHTMRLLSYKYKDPFTVFEKPLLNRILSNYDLCEFVIRTPGSLGGLPIMQWTRYFMKGEVDDLSWDIPAIRFRRNRVSDWDLKRVIDGYYTPEHVNLSQLILDPHSLPLDRPRDRKKLIKDAIAEQMLDHTRNVWIREIFNESNNTAEQKLMEALTATRPFYPEIMSDVYSLSLCGVRDALLSRFTMTRTVANMTGNRKFITEIASGNAQLLRFIISRYDQALELKGIPNLPESCYEICSQLRALWGPQVEHKNIGVYNPFDFKLQFFDSKYSMISASSRTSDVDDLTTSIGPYPPNFGTKTRQKVSDHGFKIVTSSSTVSDMKRLVMIFSELGSDPSFAGILSQITKSRSPCTIEHLASILPTSFGGAAAHRHASIDSTAFSILGSRTVPTHLNFCSDLAGILSGGEFDYPIAFQEFYLTLTNVFQNTTRLGLLNGNAAIGFLMSDNYEPLPTDVVKCEVSPKLTWTVKPTNALCYIGALQAREIPIIPQSSQATHVSAENIPPAVLIYNRLLTKYSSRRRLFTTTSAVNLPVEVLDMKEFNHCPLTDLMRGACWFVSAMAIYVAITEFRQSATVALNETIHKLSRGCAALLSRMMLHPDFSSSLFATSNDILCEPGVSGARSAADNLTGELVNRVKISIMAREFVTYDVPFVMFADFSSNAALPIEIHCICRLALSSFDLTKILLTQRQLLALHTARNSLVSQINTLYRVLSITAATNLQLRNSPKRRTVDTNRPVRLLFCNQVPEEAIRALRSLPREERLKLSQSLNKVHALRRLVNITVRFSRVQQEGSLRPLHECPDEPAFRLREHTLNLLQRPYHGKSSALSIWGPIFSKHQRFVKGRDCLSIGVGHGAVAASCLNEGASHVYGIDLRSSFPVITQRELTYIPPEIIRSCRSTKFSWSRFISITGGDVLENKSYLKQAEPCQTVIVDIEQNYTETLDLLAHLPSRVSLFLRVHCCLDQLRYLIDSLLPNVVYCTSAIHTHKNSFILFCEDVQVVNQNANYERVTIESVPFITRLCEKNTDYTLYALNDYIRPFGYVASLPSFSEVERIAVLIRRDGLNAQDSALSDQLVRVHNELQNMILVLRSLPTIDLRGLMQLDTPVRRLACCWIANIGFDLTEEIQNLRD